MLFNRLGRNIPSDSCRVFSDAPKEFYKIDPLVVDYPSQHETAQALGLIPGQLLAEDVENCISNIKRSVMNNKDYANLFLGPAIPFCFGLSSKNDDIGTILQSEWLPLLKQQYESRVPGAYFKATLQGNTQLEKSLSIAKNTGYEAFLSIAKKGLVAGFFFPTAFQEFDVQSQRMRISELPKVNNLDLSLSGPLEMIYALTSYPKLLFSKESYSPILCASALQHDDPRMILTFKSYGPHLEFWLMSQMLTPEKTQVSEQWSGGITIFKSL